MKLKDKDKNKDCKWQSFFFDQIRMHKQYSPHGDYDHMGEVINLLMILKWIMLYLTVVNIMI